MTIWKRYEISVDLNLPPHTDGDYGSVIEFRDASLPESIEPWKVDGDRVPAILQHRSSSKLTLANYISDQASYYHENLVVPENQWFNLKFVQVRLMARV